LVGFVVLFWEFFSGVWQEVLRQKVDADSILEDGDFSTTFKLLLTCIYKRLHSDVGVQSFDVLNVL